ncbi:MAG: LysE family translocator [Alphaproteobacteria bacterium]|nr:LysE family translocator [Alphaproteobacteria bacterium]
MTFQTLLALVGFAFVMSITPGPGNFLLLASGANFGILRTVPLILGISFGFLSMVLAVGLGLGQILRQYEIVYALLRFVCLAYVIWLAWKIAHIRSVGVDDTGAGSNPISFLQAAAFQLVNPKAWAVALIVTVSYTSAEDYYLSLVSMIAVFAIVNLPAISAWAIFGVGLRRLLSDERRLRAFNIGMASLLVVSMVPVVLGA